MTACSRVKRTELLKPPLLVVDLRDKSDGFVSKGLRLCDYYVERSFYRPDVARPPPDLGRNVTLYPSYLVEVNVGCSTTYGSPKSLSIYLA